MLGNYFAPLVGSTVTVSSTRVLRVVLSYVNKSGNVTFTPFIKAVVVSVALSVVVVIKSGSNSVTDFNVAAQPVLFTSNVAVTYVSKAVSVEKLPVAGFLVVMSFVIIYSHVE